jgi:hypothetical protein
MTNGREKRQGPITANQLKEVRRDCLKVILRWYINKSTINHHKETDDLDKQESYMVTADTGFKITLFVSEVQDYFTTEISTLIPYI